MGDFFSSVPPVHSSTPPEDLNPFQQAITRRFSHAPPTLCTARIQPSTPGPLQRAGLTRIASDSLSLLSLTSPPPRFAFPVPPPSAVPLLETPITLVKSEAYPRFTPLQASALPNLLLSAASASSSSPSSSLIVLDIRGHLAFLTSRITSAMNLSVPTTLLKRPAFSLAKLAEMMPTPSDRERFLSWRGAESIVIYDAETPALTQGCSILSLLRKFDNEGFTGSLCYIQGGFAAVSRHQQDFIDSRPLPALPLEDQPSGSGTLQTRHLPASAFLQVSTTNAGKRVPTLDTLGSDERGLVPGKGPPSARSAPSGVIAANPFYDNIRQNIELSSGITERIPLRMPQYVTERQEELPFPWLREIVRKASAQSAGGVIGGESLEDLAMQFYRIELGEQRRLTGVMDHHTRECVSPGAEPGTSELAPPFPYSITAGIEKGSKNRYRNIWPFEHARVRLQQPYDDDCCDYINASYIQPRGTCLKYIATQGPLMSTFTDFWTLCWEQNVNIIVMLTKQMEGFSVKCHCYWEQGKYGPFHLQSVGVDGPSQLEKNMDVVDRGARSAFDFTPRSVDPPASNKDGSADNQEQMIIRRTFMLSHDLFPDTPPRKVVQLQYIGWPDLTVPDSPAQLLQLVKEVNALRDEFRGSGPEWRRRHQNSSDASSTMPKTQKSNVHPGPVLVHCSAGVGRTGSFVIVDAVLDAIRRETRAKFAKAAETRGAAARAPFPPPEGQGQGSTDISVPSALGLPRQLSSDDHSDISSLATSDHEIPLRSDTRSVKKRRSSSGAHSSSASASLSELRPEEGERRPTSNLFSLRRHHHQHATPLHSTPPVGFTRHYSLSHDRLNDSSVFQPHGAPSHTVTSIVPSAGSSLPSTASSLRPSGAAPLVAPLVASPGKLMDMDLNPTPSSPLYSSLNRQSSVSGTSSSPKASIFSNDTSISMDWDRLTSSSTSLSSPMSSVDEGCVPLELKKSNLPFKKSGLASASFPAINFTSVEGEDCETGSSPPGSLAAFPGGKIDNGAAESLALLYPFPSDRDQRPSMHVPQGSMSLALSPTPPQSVMLFPSSPPHGATTVGSDSLDTKPAPGSRHSQRHPASTSASAYDYTAPRKIRLPRNVKPNLRAVDSHGRSPRPQPQMPRSPSASRTAPIPIPQRNLIESTEGPLGTSSSDDLSTSPPSPLSEMEDPIPHVLEDMRQQRMSLCQSLRQYVFVHLAILEGALSVVDEVKTEMALSGESSHQGVLVGPAKNRAMDVDGYSPSLANGIGGRARPSKLAAGLLSSVTPHPHTLKSSTAQPRLSPPHASSLMSIDSPLEGQSEKRLATLTDSIIPPPPPPPLLSVSSSPLLVLSKRPSIKRKQRSVGPD